MKTVGRTAAALAMVLGVSPVLAADMSPPKSTPSGLMQALIDDATITVHLRNYLLDRYQDGAPGPGAWALGGWVGYESGWIADLLKFGAVGYTSQPLWAPESRSGSLLLLPDQRGYSVLGQAYATLKYQEQQIILYRQLVDEPEVNPQDSRMTPNTFEGGMFYGKLGPLDLHAGVLTAMKPRDAKTFTNMADAAGASGTSNMYLASLNLPEFGPFAARASIYQVPNLLASSYAEGSWKLTADEVTLRLSGQLMYQTSIGEDLLTGPDFEAWVGGVLGAATWRGLTLKTGYTSNGSDDEWQAPYGAWPGFTHMILKDFDRAGEEALYLGSTLDLSDTSLKGLVLTAEAAIDLAVGEDQEERDEYNFTADYDFADMAGEQWWLAPLQLSLQYAILNTDEGEGTIDQTTDFRVILNYQVTTQGGGGS